MIQRISSIAILFSLLTCAFIIACASGDDDEADGQDGEPVEIAEENMIDDLDDGDDAIIATEERAGDWYTFNDGTGDQTPGSGAFTPEAGGPEGSAYAAHTTGGGFAEWGAGIGFDINNGADEDTGDGGVDESDGGVKANGELKGVFDASGFQGVAFQAKGNVQIRAMIAIRSVISEEEGGTCVQGDTDEEECHNSHGLFLTLSDTWQQYQLPFDQIAQDEGWGQTFDFDPTTVVSILFQVGPNEDFDFWIDEVGFY